MKTLALLLLIACGAPEPEHHAARLCCVCWLSTSGGCTALRREDVPPLECESKPGPRHGPYECASEEGWVRQ